MSNPSGIDTPALVRANDLVKSIAEAQSEGKRSLMCIKQLELMSILFFELMIVSSREYNFIVRELRWEIRSLENGKFTRKRTKMEQSVNTWMDLTSKAAESLSAVRREGITLF